MLGSNHECGRGPIRLCIGKGHTLENVVPKSLGFVPESNLLNLLFLFCICSGMTQLIRPILQLIAIFLGRFEFCTQSIAGF